MTRQQSSSRSVSSKSTISTAVTTTSFSSNGSGANNAKAPSIPSPSHKRGSVFGGIPHAPNLGSPKAAATSSKSIEHRSPTVSSKNVNDNMARVVDRTGAFPQMPPPQANLSSQHQSSYGGGGGRSQRQEMSSNGSLGSNASAGGGIVIPPSPRRAYSIPPQIPPSPSSHGRNAKAVDLTPKLRGTTISSGASVGSNGG
eukprot:CAMPEP_0172554096 /NCGR_PEP_ID=MMETSP1067-20121228/53172_1 /TAXON_ID=265564 ORGANISM="Thalassiosira punctigera, Strain Tpunct2005C2" /NCGR_SAMPLE_ID=MMETSP1067 /ASSEMBLY_ACC=CAM_ASM_000444 /LENGTH=198 /DNA_ID=CAMNT_0013342405 /DNA_START=323 /DNA_END=915 /DNA_ORIENTATION=-